VGSCEVLDWEQICPGMISVLSVGKEGKTKTICWYKLVTKSFRLFPITIKERDAKSSFHRLENAII